MIVVPKFVASVSKVGPNRNPNSVDRQSRDFYPPTVGASPLTWLGFPGDLLKNALRVCFKNPERTHFLGDSIGLAGKKAHENEISY
jgi:hypothetical protein